MIEQANMSITGHTQRRLHTSGVIWLMAITTIVLVGFGGLVFVVQPWGPSSAWEAADHNRDGILTRDEMSHFVTQKPHRTDRLLMHFEAADVDKDGVVTLVESGKYGNEIGSNDPFLRKAKPIGAYESETDSKAAGGGGEIAPATNATIPNF